MKFEPVPALSVYYHRSPDEKLLVGELRYAARQVAFQYATEFLATGLELAPIKLKPTPDVVIGGPFDGLPGLFDDSLPDGWGCVLLDRYVRSIGGQPGSLTPLDRLAWVGSRAIGALSYEPEHGYGDGDEHVVDLHVLSEQAQQVVDDETPDALATLLRLGGSPQGARPKALVLLSDDRLVNAEYREGFTPYLVKFSAATDPRNVAGAVEFAYSNMARDAGVDMPVTRLLGKKGKHRGYFAIERFDRRGQQRLHTATMGGLVHVKPGESFISYSDLMEVTQGLTQDARQVKQMFRRAVFNVYAHNRDDHSRNFAFLMEPDGRWHLAPAYDITYNDGPGGEHQTDVMGEGKAPGEEHLLQLAKESSIRTRDAKRIVAQVRDACAGWRKHAKAAGVPVTEAKRIEKALASL